MILSRLKKAVQEQNWFAVVLEVLIVIVGVVIGFQITIWGQGRSNTAKEISYLEQLSEDLHGTASRSEAQTNFFRRADEAATNLVRAFRTNERPSADSILTWVHYASRLDRSIAVSGAAEALVETGDLNLIRTDSLRSAITTYLDVLQLYEGYLDSNSDRAVVHVENLSGLIDYGEALLVTSPVYANDSTALNELNPFPTGALRTPFPLDVETFLTSREAYTSAWNLWRRRYLMKLNRNAIERESSKLLTIVEAELADE